MIQSSLPKSLSLFVSRNGVDYAIWWSIAMMPWIQDKVTQCLTSTTCDCIPFVVRMPCSKSPCKTLTWLLLSLVLHFVVLHNANASISTYHPPSPIHLDNRLSLHFSSYSAFASVNMVLFFLQKLWLYSSTRCCCNRHSFSYPYRQYDHTWQHRSLNDIPLVSRLVERSIVQVVGWWLDQASQSCQRQPVEEVAAISLVCCCVVSMVDEGELNVDNGACCYRGIYVYGVVVVVANVVVSGEKKTNSVVTPTLARVPSGIPLESHDCLLAYINIPSMPISSMYPIQFIMYNAAFYFHFTLPYYPCFPTI